MLGVELVKNQRVPLLGRDVLAKEQGHVGIVAQIVNQARQLVRRRGTTRRGLIVHLESGAAGCHQRCHGRRLRGGIAATGVGVEHSGPLEGGRAEVERHGNMFRFGGITDGTRSMRGILVVLHHLGSGGGCATGDAALVAVHGAEIVVGCTLVPARLDQGADALAHDGKVLPATFYVMTLQLFVRGNGPIGVDFRLVLAQQVAHGGRYLIGVEDISVGESEDGCRLLDTGYDDESTLCLVLRGEDIEGRLDGTFVEQLRRGCIELQGGLG